VLASFPERRLRRKTFAGLRDAWLYADRQQARSMLVKLADWASGIASRLSDEQLQAMLGTEHGGMNEVLADVAAITGDERYLELARRFSHHALLDPLLQGEDRLDGLHANAQIPKVVDFEPMIENVEGPETCNTYNMLRLTRLLYQAAPEQKYVDYYERAPYNHILASQGRKTGGLVYFTPIRPQHYRVYSQVHESMWCCVGSGIENHVKYGEFVYARNSDDLFVNLYIPSRIDWPARGLALRQETEFPDRAATRFVFESDTETGLQIRYPSWAAADEATVLINDKPQGVSATPGSYIHLRRAWKKGDVVTLELPMATHAERLPDGSDYFALLYGPIVLSAKTTSFADEVLDDDADDSRMGHIPSGPMCPLPRSPILVSASMDIAQHLERVDDSELRFRFNGMIEPAAYADTELIPFFRVHHSRYMLYWPYSTPDTGSATH
jgi:uncharacterized protein